MWTYNDGDKYLEITVNLSKPEKDNKEIAKLLTLKKSGEKYPECLLCNLVPYECGRRCHCHLPFPSVFCWCSRL